MIKIFYIVNNYAMKKILLLFQEFIKCLLFFLLSFIWLRFFLNKMWLIIVISTFITILLEGITLCFNRKKLLKQNLSIVEKEDAENMFFSLVTQKDNLDFFYKLAKTRHTQVMKNSNFIKVTHNDKTTLLYPYLKFQKLTPDDITFILKKLDKEKKDKIIIICGEYDKTSQSFIKNFEQEILLLNQYESYFMLYKEYEYFPEINMKFKKESKLKLKDLLAYSFNKSRAKGYIISSILLFIASLFVKLNIYYCIISSILMLFALISLINPKYNKKISKELI